MGFFRKNRGVKRSEVEKTEKPCPKCDAELGVIPSSSVSPYISDYICFECSWSRPVCGDTGCDGFLEGSPTGMGDYQYVCEKCGWSGRGYEFKKKKLK